MKSRKTVSVAAAVILAAGLSNVSLQAQVAQMGTVQIQTEDAALQGLQPVAADALPQSGTFWSLANFNQPPMPFFQYSNVLADVPVPVFALPNTSGAYLVDDRAAVAADAVLSSLEGQLGIKTGGSGRVMSMQSGVPSPPDGGGGGDTNSGSGDWITNGFGYPHAFLTNPPAGSLWIETWLTNQPAAQVVVHGTQPEQVYALASRLDICATNPWTVEQTVHGSSNQDWEAASVPFLDRTNALFLWAWNWTTNDVNNNGIPDWWSWENFGNLNQRATNDYDGDGVDNGTAYTNGTEPNRISFNVHLGYQHFNSAQATGQYEVLGGVPSYAAVLVNDTNLADAVWTNYSATASFTLGPTDGVYQVMFALKGRAPNSQATWMGTSVTLDTTPPAVVITNPMTNVVTKPVIQVQGYCAEQLLSVSYSISNAVDLQTNLAGYLTGGSTPPTNAFQLFDVGLTNGVNLITLTVADLAGNVTVTNLNYMLDYSSKTNPPVMTLIWPPEGAKVSGDTFTVRGAIDDETATVTAQITDASNNVSDAEVLVERNGNLWLENLPLSDGTNWLTLTAIDAAGHSSETDMSVVKSGVALTIGDLSWLDLNQPTAPWITGGIGATNYNVSVNGMAATVYGNGAWRADNVPVSAGGVAVFTVTASPQSGSGASITTMVETDKPPQVVLVHGEWEEHTYEIVHEQSRLTMDCTWHWDEKTGGYAEIAKLDLDDTNQNSGARYWLATNGVEQFERWSVSPTNVLSTNVDLNWFWDGFTVKGPQARGELAYAVPNGSSYSTSRSVANNMDVALDTQGKQNMRRRDKLFADLVTVTPKLPPWATSYTVDPAQVVVPGLNSTLDTNSTAYGGAPGGVRLHIAPIAPVTYYVSAQVVSPSDWVIQCVATNPVDRARTTIGVGEEVNLSFVSPPSPNTTWRAGRGQLDAYTGPAMKYSAPYSAGRTGKDKVTAKFPGGGSQSIEFTLLEPARVDHAVIIETNTPPFSNGVAGASMHLTVYMWPTNVSFYKVWMEEVGQDATNITDYFADTNLFTANPAQFLRHDTADKQFKLNQDNSWGQDVRHNYYDYCVTGDLRTNSTGGWSPGGSYTWNIPWNWWLGDNYVSPKHMTNGWKQVFTIESNGTARITKFDKNWVQRTTNNVITVTNMP